MIDTQTSEVSKPLRRVLSGRVVSDKMQKTVTVLIERRMRHPLYGKYVTKSKKYHAHDEVGECRVGDWVEIVESKPISKTKFWVVAKRVQSAHSV